MKMATIAFPQFSLPSQAEEEHLFSEIYVLQREIAFAAEQAREDLRGVPLWGIQVLLHSLALRVKQVDATADLEAFSAWAQQRLDQGSAIFAETAWRPKESVLRAASERLSQLSLGQHLLLLGRAADYGRTLRWSRDADKGAAPKRNIEVAKSEGMFYTPAFVARHMARSCLHSVEGSSVPYVCDPAVGGGVLLLAAAEVLLKHYEPEHVVSHLCGADTDPIAVEIASAVICAACGVWDPATVNSPARITVGDAYGGPVIKGGDRGNAGPGALGLCWAESFPDVFSHERPGFDVVLTNPPFGRYKVDSDWAVAKEMSLDPTRVAELQEQSRQRSDFLRGSGLYTLAVRGVLDKSRIGLERAIQLTRSGGWLGAIIPSTIAGDLNSQKLREHLLWDWSLKDITVFPEDARLFFDVNQSTCVIFAHRRGRTNQIAVRQNAYREEDLQRPADGWWTAKTIQRMSSHVVVPLTGGEGGPILARMHRHPRLKSYRSIVNARGEVDLTVFRDALTKNRQMLPLIRGDQVDQYRTNLPTDKPTFVDPEIYMEKLKNSSKRGALDKPRIVGRQCSYLYRPQRLSFALIAPGNAVANSCNYLLVENHELRLFLLALLNSELMNWRFTLLNSNNHVANYEIDDFPIPNFVQVTPELRKRITGLSTELCSAYEPTAAKALDEAVFDLFGLDVEERRFVRRANEARGR